MAVYGRATKRLITPGDSDPRIQARIGILHVDAGNTYDLFDYFSERSGGIESHFHIPKQKVGDVNLFQYRDTAFQADANLRANDFALSYETQGLEAGFWTPHQINEIKLSMLWCKREHDIPLRVVDSWDDPKGGWGYHTLFGSPSPWTPVVKSCPGPNRKKQFHELLVPWMKIRNEGGFILNTEDKAYLENRFVSLESQVKKLSERVGNLGKWDRARDLRLRAALTKEFNLTEEQLDRMEELLQ